MFTKFTSIEKMSDAWVQMTKQQILEIKFRSKIKLHGTNAGVRREGDEFFFQKRTSDVTPLADNAGFASWAITVPWGSAKTDKKDYIVYGEWAGAGVQKQDAVSDTPKHFYVFAVMLGDQMITEPSLIVDFVPDHKQISVLPWFDEPTSIKLTDNAGAKVFADRLSADVDKIGEEDPYIKDKYNVSGGGEGLVVSPWDESGVVPAWFYNTFTFKVKSQAHIGGKSKGLKASIYVEVPASVMDFVDTFVTEPRMEQMVNTFLDGSYNNKGIATFLSELNKDILKESVNELAAMGGVDWKIISKEISKRGVAWFKSKSSM